MTSPPRSPSTPRHSRLLACWQRSLATLVRSRPLTTRAIRPSRGYDANTCSHPNRTFQLSPPLQDRGDPQQHGTDENCEVRDRVAVGREQDYETAKRDRASHAVDH